jgi:uncharacterized caspase-like protein
MTFGPASHGSRSARSVTLLLVVLWLTVLTLSPALAEEARPLKGVALVIGQSKYRDLPALANAANDAREVTRILTALGFEARSVADRDTAKLRRDLDRFAEDAEGADVAILYYSGHGIEAGGENYLLPVDADLAALENAGRRLAPLSTTMERLKQSVPVTILLIDACRTNPFPPGVLVKTEASQPGALIGATGLGAPKGAVPIEGAPQADTLGIVIGYAAEPGRAALDGEAGGNSPYAAALIRHLSAMKGSEFGTVMRMVTEEVYLKTQGRQRPWVNESLRRLLYFGAVPEEPKGEEALITGERRQLLLTIAALPDAERLQVEGIAKDGGIPLDALYGVLRALGEQQMPQDPEALDKLLRAQAEKLKTMMAERQALEADDPEITRLAQAADHAIEEGAIATARQFLDQAVARVDATQGAVDQAEAKFKAKRLSDAAVYARRADAAGLASDYLAAAKDYQKAFEFAEKWDLKTAWQYKLNTALMLNQQGFDRGDTIILQQSIEIYKEALALATRADPSRDLGAATQYDLANALAELASLENSTARFEEAAATFRATLQVYSRETKPEDWAAVQHGLGLVLHKLGKHEKGTVKMREAVATYRMALTERTRERFPDGWAGTMQNLGAALLVQGMREDSIPVLEEAAVTLRAALEVRRREIRPIDWAVTQYNLGLVLRSLGKLKNDPTLYHEAVVAARQALEATSKDRFPVYWAQIEKGLRETQRILGSALLQLGENDLTVARLEEAVTTFRELLESSSRESDPPVWAEGQYSLGLALYKLGRRESGTAYLEEAVKAFEAALTVQLLDSTALGWAKTQDELGRALQIIGYRKNSAADLEDAMQNTQDAIEGFQQVGASLDIEAAERQLTLTRSLLELVRKP